MAKINEAKIVETKESETIIENEIVVVTTKLVKNTIVDMSGGKVQIYADGYANGETINVTVNGKTQNVEIIDGLGIYCSNYSFMQYPAIKIND